MRFRSAWAIATVIMWVICPGATQSQQAIAVREKAAEETSLSEIIRGSAGPFTAYCDGYGNAGASGTGYVSVITLHVGKAPKTLSIVGQKGDGLDGTVAFDKAEATEAYIGQINLIVASSFSGLNGVIWGYDVAKADELTRSSRPPLFTRRDGLAEETPVYSLEPLLDAGKRLFGTRDNKRFPLLPGAHVTAAHKDIIVTGPTTVWCGIGIGIAHNRSRDSNLFMELCGELTSSAHRRSTERYLQQVLIKLADSIMQVGKNQSVKYKEIYVGVRHDFIPAGYVGAALATAPYVVLAKNAIPHSGPQALLQMTLSEWENDRKTMFMKSTGQ